MAIRKKISQMLTAVTASLTDTLPILRGGVNYKLSIQSIVNLVTKNTIGLSNVDNTADTPV